MTLFVGFAAHAHTFDFRIFNSRPMNNDEPASRCAQIRENRHSIKKSSKITARSLPLLPLESTIKKSAKWELSLFLSNATIFPTLLLIFRFFSLGIFPLHKHSDELKNFTNDPTFVLPESFSVVRHVRNEFFPPFPFMFEFSSSSTFVGVGCKTLSSLNKVKFLWP